MTEPGNRSVATTVIRRAPTRTDPAEPERHRAGTKTRQARTWLADYLTACDGSAESAVVRTVATSAGFSPGVLYLATKGLVRITSIGGVGHRTLWTLARPGDEAGCVTAAGSTRDWLAAHLSITGGRAPSQEVQAAAVAGGHSRRLLERARIALDVRSRTIPGTLPRRTEWLLPTVDDAAAGRTSVAVAEAWLAGYLVNHDGSADSGEIKRAAVEAGHPPKTLDRARRRAGFRVESIPGAFPRRTVWLLG
jgi:hypothetical protein